MNMYMFIIIIIVVITLFVYLFVYFSTIMCFSYRALPVICL
jgi:hypothetical protein